MGKRKIGLGVLIDSCCGNENNRQSILKCKGERITEIKFDEKEIVLYFQSGRLEIWDNGQSCCETRYMICDDDLLYYKDSIFIDVKIKDAPDVEDERGEFHEVQFLEIVTDKGSIVLSNHNEHNGYYGGFSISAKYLKKIIRKKR